MILRLTKVDEADDDPVYVPSRAIEAIDVRDGVTVVRLASGKEYTVQEAARDLAGYIDRIEEVTA